MRWFSRNNVGAEHGDAITNMMLVISVDMGTVVVS
jgi:hypothetical protein